MTQNPPEITQVRTTTSLIPDRVNTVQTIISWKTDKPASSQVLFADIGQADFKELTDGDSVLIKEHVAITTNLKPGSYYRIKVLSVDAGGHATESDIYTIMTPKPKESIVDLILSNLESTFGFLKQK